MDISTFDLAGRYRKKLKVVYPGKNMFLSLKNYPSFQMLMCRDHTVARKTFSKLV